MTEEERPRDPETGQFLSAEEAEQAYDPEHDDADDDTTGHEDPEDESSQKLEEGIEGEPEDDDAEGEVDEDEAT